MGLSKKERYSWLGAGLMRDPGSGRRSGDSQEEAHSVRGGKGSAPPPGAGAACDHSGPLAPGAATAGWRSEVRWGMACA